MTNNISLLPRHCGTTAPTTLDPLELLSSMIDDFFLTPIVSVFDEMQGRWAGTTLQLKKIDEAIYCAVRAETLARQPLDFARPRSIRIRAFRQPSEYCD